MTHPKCADCRFFEPWDRAEDEQYGSCRFNPPSGIVVTYDDWCGRFEPKIEPKIEPEPTAYGIPLSEYPDDLLGNDGLPTYEHAAELINRRTYENALALMRRRTPRDAEPEPEPEPEPLDDLPSGTSGQVLNRHTLEWEDPAVIRERAVATIRHLDQTILYHPPRIGLAHAIWREGETITYFYGELWEFLIQPENQSGEWLIALNVAAGPGTPNPTTGVRWVDDGTVPPHWEYMDRPKDVYAGGRDFRKTLRKTSEGYESTMSLTLKPEEAAYFLKQGEGRDAPDVSDDFLRLNAITLLNQWTRGIRGQGEEDEPATKRSSDYTPAVSFTFETPSPDDVAEIMGDLRSRAAEFEEREESEEESE